MVDLSKLQRELALFLGNANGVWAYDIRRALQMTTEVFWGAVGLDEQTGGAYEICDDHLPRPVVTAIVYVHLCKLPVVFVLENPKLVEKVILALHDARQRLTDEDRRRFLGWQSP